MTTWTDGGDCGRLKRTIMNEDGSRAICTVWTRQSGYGYGDEPWPEGEANFRLILKAPQMLEALEEMLWSMSMVLAKIRRQETIESQLGTVVTRRVERTKTLARAAIAAVKGEDDETG